VKQLRWLVGAVILARVIAPNPHARIDTDNRERDRRLAALIRKHPAVIARAQQNLREWGAHWGGLNPAWEEWKVLLQMLTAAQVADFLESSTPKANRLRQSSPFIGVSEENGPAPVPHAA